MKKGHLILPQEGCTWINDLDFSIQNFEGGCLVLALVIDDIRRLRQVRLIYGSAKPGFELCGGQLCHRSRARHWWAPSVPVLLVSHHLAEQFSRGRMALCECHSERSPAILALCIDVGSFVQ